MRALFLFLVVCGNALAQPKQWLVTIYMAADNDLSPYSYHDLWEMEHVGSTADADVVVFHDGRRPDGLRYYHLEKSAASPDYRPLLDRFVREKGLEAEEPAVREELFWESEGPSLVHTAPDVLLPEGDSGDVRTLGDFLRWAIPRYPARRTLFLGWGHGDGYDARWDSERRGGFAFDSTSKNHMALNQMAAEVKRALGEVNGGRPFDIAGSESCLGEQLEIGYEFLGLADYFFGSATLAPKKGFDYAKLLGWLAGQARAETRAIAAGIPARYGEAVGAAAPGGPPVSMATWSTKALPAVRDAMSRIGARLGAWLDEPAARLERIVRVEEAKGLIGKTLRFGGVTNDLYGFFTALRAWEKGPPGIDALVSAADAALDRSVLAKWVSPESPSKGVSVWLPGSEWDFEQMYPKYAHSRFYGDGGKTEWARFIERLYSLPERGIP